MAPPGRRRSLSTFLVPFLVFFLAFLHTAHAQSVVLGLDVGTEYIKAALVKPGVPLDIVLTKDSKRKEAAAIGFKPVHGASPDQLPERLYGSDALAVGSRFPADIYPNLKPLLGSLQDSLDAAQAYKRRYPALEQSPLRNAVGLKNSVGNEPFSVEELLGMEMANMKANAQVMAGSGLAVRNAVITVPSFFTVDERRAVELAAKLAGLNVMSLISDGMAVGLNYATSRSFPNIDKGDKPEHHLVYDMGAGSTTATVLKFQARTVKDVGKFNKTIQEVNTLGVGWDRSLGGDVLNELLVDDMVEKFVASSGAKSAGVSRGAVQAHGRTMAKLWREAERLRQVLSANTATSGNFESLFEDVDFKYKLSRTDFEAMAESYKARISLPLQTALANAKLTIEDLDSVVLHGGMVRTPFVQKELETQIKDAAKLRSNVNADEAAVFGAAYRAAGLSPSFRVKDIKSNDIAIYGATLKWTAKGKARTQNVFVPTSQGGVVKQMPFNMTDDFSLSIFQQVPSSSGEIEERGVANYEVANLTATIAELVSKHGCSKEDINTVLSLRLDPVIGVPELSGGSSSCETGEKKGGVMDGVKGLFGLGDKKDQEPLSDEAADEKTETISESASATSTDTDGESSSGSSSKRTKSAKPPKPTKKVQTINLAIETTRTDRRVQTEEQYVAQKDRLKAFDKSDRARRAREEAFNTLEAFLYRTSDIVSGEEFVSVSTTQQRSAIEELARETSEWLHSGEGSSAGTEIITEKYTALTALIDPVQERKEQSLKRPKAVESLQKALKQTEDLVAKMRDTIDKAAEAAASAASSIATEASSTASSMTEPLDDLEDEGESSSSTTTSATASVPTAIFSETDYERASSALESSRDWLKQQLEEQGALSASDEPVLTYGDVNSVTKQLNELLAHMLSKERTAKQQSSYSSNSSKSRSKKTSSSSSSKKSASKSSSDKSTATEATPESSASATEGDGHKEL